MSKYRKKPVVIEAVRFTGEVDPVIEWARSLGKAADEYPMGPFAGHGLRIGTLEGEMIASPGDWIIRGVAGELCPCKPDIFEATYEPEESESVEDLARRLIASKHFVSDGQGGDWQSWDILVEDELRERLGMERS